MRLVEQHRRIASGALFVTPVGEFTRYHRVNVCAKLRIPQHFDGIAGGPEHAFEILLSHEDCPLPLLPRMVDKPRVYVSPVSETALV
jgi:hypothetical protein